MRRVLALAIALAIPAGVALALSGALAQAAGPSVLRVGTYNGVHGQYNSIQAAVDAAKPGDWILIAPGDYKTHRSRSPSGRSDTPAGVLVTTPRIRLRGMSRNAVIVDGTKSGPQCSRKAADQNFGPKGSGGRLGLNGIMVWKADNVWVQNLRACNFLSGSGSSGNEIWWNGGDGGGKIGGWGYYGSYLTATSTFYKNSSTAAAYGIFSSDWSGGRWDRMYSSNMADSNYYIGACQRVCDQVVDHVRSQYSAQGYSGTNAGGKVVIEHSEFDHNRTGFTAGALNNDDWPSPQNGACPKGTASRITHTYSCWVFIHNYVHDNNDVNVPTTGIAGEVPTGAGLQFYGGRNNTVKDNVFANNGAWGVVMYTFPDTETPPADVVAAGAACRGGIQAGAACIYDDWGNALIGNTFSHNGSFHNDTNGDFGEVTSTTAATNCFHHNVERGGGKVKSSPAGLQQSKPVCNRHKVPPDTNSSLATQLVCDAGLGPCPPGSKYPTRKKVVMHRLPNNLPTMPDPCAGVPANPWCPKP